MNASKMRIAGAVAIAWAMMMSVGLADSSRCNGGVFYEGGVGVANEGDPVGRQGWAAVCSDGSTVPIGGHVEIGGNLNTGEEGYVEADGDPSNEEYHECADGFVHIYANSDGDVRIYSGPDGNKEDTDPSKSGKQPAQPKTPQEFVEDTIEDCS